ncbi:MAG: hypothetical protein ACI8RD_007602, partial [Bacillariaceae sp.]
FSTTKIDHIHKKRTIWDISVLFNEFKSSGVTSTYKVHKIMNERKKDRVSKKAEE